MQNFNFLHTFLPFMKNYICNEHTVHAVSQCNLDRNMVFAKPIYIVQSKVTKWYDKRGQGYILCNWVEYHGANLSGILCFARKCLFVCTLGSQAPQFHYGCILYIFMVEIVPKVFLWLMCVIKKITKYVPREEYL